MHLLHDLDKADRQKIYRVKQKKLENLLKLILANAKEEQNWLVYIKCCLSLCLFYGLKNNISYFLNKKQLNFTNKK